MMGIHPALKCFNKRKCRFLSPCFYVCKRPVSISVKRGFYARKIPLLENSDSIQEFLIFLHSFARVSNTTIKGAPAGMGESARSGNGYPAAMCCLNCIVNDEIFFFEPSVPPRCLFIDSSKLSNTMRCSSSMRSADFNVLGFLTGIGILAQEEVFMASFVDADGRPRGNNGTPHFAIFWT